MSASGVTAAVTLSATPRQRLLALAALVLIALLSAAGLRHLRPHAAPGGVDDPWLALHLLSVLPALPLGAVMMLQPKGGRMHRLLGRSWAVLMLLAAASGLKLGHGWSPIHLLSLLTLVALPAAIVAAIRGDIRAHRGGMTVLFASLVAAGFFTLLPSRLLGGWLFGTG